MSPNIYFSPLNTGNRHQMAIEVDAVMELSPHTSMDHVVGPFLSMGMDAFLSVNTNAGSGRPVFLAALGEMNVNPNMQFLDADRKVITVF